MLPVVSELIFCLLKKIIMEISKLTQYITKLTAIITKVPFLMYKKLIMALSALHTQLK